jgi:hypothetical protein
MAMDDLDKFREIWAQKHKDENRVPDLPEPEQIIRKRSRNAISRFRLSLLIELWIGVLILAGLSVFFLVFPTRQYGFYLVAIIAMMLVCVIYYFFQYKSLKSLEPSFDTGVKESITQILKWMNQFVMMYLRLNQIIFAFCILVLLIIKLNTSTIISSLFSNIPRGIVLLAFVLLSVIVTILVYPIQRLYIRWMFGKYVDKLRDNLRELEVNGAE